MVVKNKAQAIRDEIKSRGKKVRGRDIVAALAAKGITVAPSQVSNALKAAGFRRVRRGKIAKAAAPAKPDKRREVELDLNDLIRTKKLADQLGGTNDSKMH